MDWGVSTSAFREMKKNETATSRLRVARHRYPGTSWTQKYHPWADLPEHRLVFCLAGTGGAGCVLEGKHHHRGFSSFAAAHSGDSPVLLRLCFQSKAKQSMPRRRRRPLQAVGLALLALAPPTTTTGFAVAGYGRSGTKMKSQVVDAVTPAAKKERQERELDPSMPIPKERLYGMPLSRYKPLRDPPCRLVRPLVRFLPGHGHLTERCTGRS